MHPRISVITPLHNKGGYIGFTIESLLRQSMVDFEMLIVENGSTDEGPLVVRQFSDPRISLIIADSTVRGPGAARNHGLSAARGQWVLFLDADDLLEPDYLAQRLTVLEKYPDATVVAGPWKNFRDDTPGVLEKHLPNGWKPPFGPPPPSIYAYSPWALHAAIVRREVLGKNPWLPELDRTPAEDNAFWFRVLLDRIIHWNDCSGALYRKQTCNSRDESGRDPKSAFVATRAMLSANRDHLESLGRRPTSNMPATAVRMLERLLRRAVGDDTLQQEIRQQINAELTDTSCLDPGMLLRRMGFQPGKTRNQTNG
jgi:glycosyltransferase involved in cell wall biosynthesis